MSDGTLVLILLAIGILVLKSTGPVALGSRPLPASLAKVADLVPAALLAALVLTSGFVTGGQSLAVDARAGGVGAAAIALRLRAPFIVAVTLAAATTALLRLVAT